jgi:hypothetical protein
MSDDLFGLQEFFNVFLCFARCTGCEHLAV